MPDKATSLARAAIGLVSQNAHGVPRRAAVRSGRAAASGHSRRRGAPKDGTGDGPSSRSANSTAVRSISRPGGLTETIFSRLSRPAFRYLTTDAISGGHEGRAVAGRRRS